MVWAYNNLPKNLGKRLYTICILSFCCLSRSNGKTQDMMLTSTQETLLISDSMIGSFFNHQKDSCVDWPTMLWTVEAIGYKLVFTDLSVWLYNFLHIHKLLAMSLFIRRVLDYRIGLLLSTRHNIHHQVKWHYLKSIGEETWMMWPSSHQCTDCQGHQFMILLVGSWYYEESMASNTS